jgi:hypothetical protein
MSKSTDSLEKVELLAEATTLLEAALDTMAKVM